MAEDGSVGALILRWEVEFGEADGGGDDASIDGKGEPAEHVLGAAAEVFDGAEGVDHEGVAGDIGFDDADDFTAKADGGALHCPRMFDDFVDAMADAGIPLGAADGIDDVGAGEGAQCVGVAGAEGFPPGGGDFEGMAEVGGDDDAGGLDGEAMGAAAARGFEDGFPAFFFDDAFELVVDDEPADAFELEVVEEVAECALAGKCGREGDIVFTGDAVGEEGGGGGSEDVEDAWYGGDFGLDEAEDFDAEAEPGAIGPGDELKEAVGAQPAHACANGHGGDAEAFAESGVGHSRVGSQFLDETPVEVIEAGAVSHAASVLVSGLTGRQYHYEGGGGQREGAVGSGRVWARLWGRALVLVVSPQAAVAEGRKGRRHPVGARPAALFMASVTSNQPT